MRNLFLLLLLVNLLLLGWQRWIQPSDAPDPFALAGLSGEGNEPELVWLGRSASDDDNAQQPAGDPVSLVCARIGPFAREDRAEQAAETLQADGLAAAVERSNARLWVGHWVQVTGFDEWSRADQALERLAAAGLKDSYIVNADAGYKISLGVFRESAGADRVAATARQAGFEPVVEDRYRPGTELWLVVGYPAGQPPRLAELSAGQDQILRQEPAECPPRNGSPDSGAGADFLQ